MKFSDLFKTEEQIKKDEDLIHNAAIENLNPLDEDTIEELDESIKVNFDEDEEAILIAAIDLIEESPDRVDLTFVKFSKSLKSLKRKLGL